VCCDTVKKHGATPATKNDVRSISDKLDKMSKSLVVDNNTMLLQLTEEIKELRRTK